MPAWSPDGQSIAFVSTRKQPERGTVAQAKRRVQLEEDKRHTRGNVVYGLDLSHEGNRVLLGGKQDLEVWDFDKDESQRFDFRGEWVSLAPDGQTVALCGPLIKVALGDLKTGKSIRDLHIGSMCTNVDFSSDGKRLVCGTIDKQAIAFDVASGKRLSVFERHHAPITRVAFLPGGDEAASNGQDKSLRIWNVQTGQERLAIVHPEVPWGLAVSPDGQLIATGTGGPTEGNPIMQRILDGQEYVIRLWDATSGQLVRELSGHTGVVYTLAFSPDGRTLASGGWDGLISLWDVAAGRQLAAVQGQGSAYGVAITADGNRLVVGGGENRSAGAPVRRYQAEQVRVFKIIEADAENPAGAN
jgi:WD40 repeat protein